MRLTRDKMWERMMASDPAFNGRFFTGVHSTGVYCLPSCRARKPKPENVRFYVTAEKAEAAGLRPCKKCRPDDFVRGIDSERTRLATVVEAIRAYPERFASVDDIAREAAMSASSLFSAFRTHYHVSPGQVLSSARVKRAADLLRGGDISAAEAGLAVGFESISTYYDNFRRLKGLPPAQYQKLGRSCDFAIELPDDYRPEYLLALLARDPESRTEKVSGKCFALGMWAEGEPVAVRGRFEGPRLYVCAERGNLFAVHAQILRLLGVEQEPSSFEAHARASGHGALIEGREGLRIPQSLTGFDGLVWSIVGQQVNLTFAAALRRRLSHVAGTRINDELSAPPTPNRVADLAPADLTPHQYSTRKAEYLIDAAKAVASGTLDFDRLALLPPAQAEQGLLAVRGIGPWSANYLMMRTLGFSDCVPVGDTGLTTGLERYFGVPRPNVEETLTLMESFRPYRSFATYHLWRSLAKNTDA